MAQKIKPMYCRFNISYSGIKIVIEDHLYKVTDDTFTIKVTNSSFIFQKSARTMRL